MPYKSQAMKTQRQKERRRREVPSLIEAPTYFKDGVEMVRNLPERPRYLTLSDGQVFDRAHLPQADLSLLSSYRIQELKGMTEWVGFKPLKGKDTQAKILQKIREKYAV